MIGVPLGAYLGLAIFMFCVGIIGVMIRRNPIVIFMCVELMLNAANLTFLAFARYKFAILPDAAQQATIETARSVMTGQMVVIFVMAVAAAEVAVGLGIIMAIYRLRNNVDIDEMNVLKG